MFEVFIDNRDGIVWNISRIISQLKIKTARIGKATTVDITFIKNSPFSDDEFKYGCGDVIRIRKDDMNIFYGYVFAVDEDENDEVKITAYDQVRYLMFSDTIVMSNTTATQLVKRIIKETGLKAGDLADTGYAIPKIMEDAQPFLDMICRALDSTLIADKELFVFYDDFGRLNLRNIKDMVLDIVIGEKSLMFSYKDKRSIDTDTYNRIKLYKDNKKTGKREAYVAENSTTMAKWGRLQYYQNIDEKMNKAQINKMLENIMALKNREQRSLKVEALGDIRIRAGNIIWLAIESKGIKQQYVVNECIQNFDGDQHTMSLDLVVYG
ncbi:XkdQ/YqbQ family protein [Paenibacillus pinihumi]|uniref:XkdQ/YqbQ family protein n=1 Tax=Paenibacillus pinihumi TaxID=669462 RepID=UPI000408B866|nr:hypothetical protein [Paenibacillus pinihumi]